MAQPRPVFVTPSTTIVQVNTLQTPYTPVILNSYNYTGQVVTVLDGTSSVGVLFSSIVVSTGSGTSFTDLSISTLINQPQGFVTTQSLAPSSWTFLNSFPFRNQYFSAGLYNLTTSTFTTAVLSSIQQYADSLNVEKLVVSGNFTQSSPIIFNQTISTFGSVDLYSSFSVWQSSFFSSGLSTFGDVKLFSSLSIDGNLVSLSSLYNLSSMFVSGSVSVVGSVSAGTLSLSSGLVTKSLLVTNTTNNSVNIAGSMNVTTLTRVVSSVNVGGNLTANSVTVETFSTLSSLAIAGSLDIQKGMEVSKVLSSQGKLLVKDSIYTTGAFTRVNENIFGGDNLFVYGPSEVGGFISTNEMNVDTLNVRGNINVGSSNVVTASSVTITSSVTLGSLTVSSLTVGGILSTSASASLSGVFNGQSSFFTTNIASTLGISSLGDVTVDGFSTLGNVSLFGSSYITKNLVVLSTSFWNQTPIGVTPSQIDGSLRLLGNINVQGTLTISSIVLPSSVIANNFFVSSLFVGDRGIVSSATISSIEASSIGTGGIQNSVFTMDMSNDLYTQNLSTFYLSTQLFQARTFPETYNAPTSFFGVAASLGVGLTASTNTFQVMPFAVTNCNLTAAQTVSSLRVLGGIITATFQGDGALLSNVAYPSTVSTSFIQVSSLKTGSLAASSFFTSTLNTGAFIPTSTLQIGDLAIYGNLLNSLPSFMPASVFPSVSTPYIVGVRKANNSGAFPTPNDLYLRTMQNIRLNTLVAAGDGLGDATLQYRGGILNYEKIPNFQALNSFLTPMNLAVGDTLRVDRLLGQNIEFKEFRGNELVLNGETATSVFVNGDTTSVALYNSGPTYVSSGYIGVGNSLSFVPDSATFVLRSTNTIQTDLSTLQFNSTLFVDRQRLAVGINTKPFYTLDVNGTAYAPSSVTTYFSTIIQNQLTVQQKDNGYWLGVGAPAPESNLRYSTDGISWSNISMNSGSFDLNQVTFLRLATNGGILTISDNYATGASLSPGKRWVAAGTYFGNTGYLAYTGGDGEPFGNQWNTANFNFVPLKRIPIQYTSAQFNGEYWLGTVINYVDQEFLNNPTTTLIRSTDGITWDFMTAGGFQANTTGGYYSNYYVGGRGCAWNGSMWVAVGLGNGSGNSILYSADGSNWSNATNGFATQEFYPYYYNGGYDVVWTGRKWVAVGQTYNTFGDINTGILYSTDGNTWFEPSTVTNAGPLVAIGWNGSRLVAGGSFGLYYSDTHGESWDTCSGATQIMGVYYGDIAYGSIVWNGSYWLASGYNGVSKSTDGINWTATGYTNPTYGLAYNSNACPSLAIGTSTLQYASTVTSYPAMNVVVGEDSNYNKTIFYSENGTTWTQATSGAFTVQGNAVAYGGGLWVAGGSNYTGSNLLKSVDGKTWTPINLGQFPPFPQFLSVFYANGTWIAGTYQYYNYNSIFYSTDGSTWNSPTTAYTTPNSTYSIGYGTDQTANNVFAIGADYPGIWTSPTGATWQQISPSGFFGANPIRALVYINSKWYALGGDGTTATIKISVDLETWGDATFATADFTTAYGIAYDGVGLYVAVGTTSGSGGTIKYSGSGSTWSNANSGEFTGIAYSVAYNSDLSLWIVTGSNDGTNADTVRYSGDGSNWSNSTGVDFPKGYGVASSAGFSAITGRQSYYNQVRFFNSPLNQIVNRQPTPFISYSSSNLVLNNTVTFDENKNVCANMQSSFLNTYSTFYETNYTNVTQNVSTQQLQVGALTLGTQYI